MNPDRVFTITKACRNCRFLAVLTDPNKGRCTVPTLMPESYGQKLRLTDWCEQWAASDDLEKVTR